MNVNSIGDSGKVIFGLGGSTQTFALNSGAAAMTFNSRQFEIAGTAGTLKIANSSSNAFTINTDLLVSGTGTRTLTLGGTGTGLSTFGGKIGNGSLTSLAITKADSGTWILSGANTYTGITTVSAGTLAFSGDANVASANPLGQSSTAAGNLLLAVNTTLRYVGAAASTDRSFTLNVTSNDQGASLDASGTGAINFTSTASPAYGTINQRRTLTLTGLNTGNNTLAANLADNGVSTMAVSITKTGIGTWVLTGSNSNTGNTTLSGGGTLVFDYGTNDDSKIAGILTLSNGGGNLTLRGGSHLEAVTSTSMTTGGGHTSITREGIGATSKLAFGAINRSQSAGVTMSLAEDNIATTSSSVFNGIMGGAITVGSNWAKVSSGNIVALTSGDYTALPVGATTASVNYQLTGTQTHTGSTSLNSLRIVGDGDDQVLTISSGNLSPSIVSAGTFGNSGGILYAGGGNDNYTITGTGNIQAQNGNQELIIHTYTGTLTVDMAVTTGSAAAGLTKVGAGTLILTKAGTYTGGTFVNQGTLLVNNTTGNGTGTSAVTVNNGAALGGNGTIGGNVTIAAGGGLTFDLTTAPGSHDKLDLAAAKTLAFSGTSTLTITASGILTEPGIYKLVTAPGGISGPLPATVNLPTDYTATVQKTGNDLELNVTGVPARGGPLDYFEFSAITSPQEAGTPITGITLTAKDAGGLTANFNGTVTFSGTAGITGDSGTFAAGVLTGLSVTPTVAGSGMTIIVTDSVSGKTGMATFNVSPGALDHFTISAIGSPQTAGTAITGITLTARDANTNTVTGFSGTVTYGGTAGISGTSASFTAGVLSGVSVMPIVAGSGMTFIVTGSGKTGTRTFNVNPGAVHHFAISGFTPTGVVGTPVTGVEITAQDANNNTVTGFSGTVTYGGTAGITGVSGNFTAGVLAGVSVTPTEAGTGVSFTVSDGSGNTGSAGSDVVWVDDMVMMAAASVQVGTTTPVASVRANSPYPPVTYAKTGGRDAALFNVNATTGELTMTAPAGVVGTKYYVLVTATDSKPVTPNVDSILVEVTSTGAAVLSGSVFMFR